MMDCCSPHPAQISDNLMCQLMLDKRSRHQVWHCMTLILYVLISLSWRFISISVSSCFNPILNVLAHFLSCICVLANVSVSEKCVQSNLAKGHFAVLSPVMAANAFVHSVQWAGTFASGGRQTVWNALICRYITVSSKVPVLVQDLDLCNKRCFQLTILLPKRHLDHPFLHSSPVCATHTDHATCNTCSNRLCLCTVCTWCGL